MVSEAYTDNTILNSFENSINASDSIANGDFDEEQHSSKGIISVGLWRVHKVALMLVLKIELHQRHTLPRWGYDLQHHRNLVRS